MAMIAGIAARLRITRRFAAERYLPLVPIAKIPMTITRERSWPPIPLRRNQRCPLAVQVESQLLSTPCDLDETPFGSDRGIGSRDRDRPLGKEIAQIIGWSGLEIIVHHLIDVVAIYIDRWNLELAVLLRQRFHVQFSLFRGQRHGKT